MAGQEHLVKQTSALSKRAFLRHTLKVVSGLSLGDVTTAERTVHLSHDAQMPHLPSVAVDNLRVIVGRPVDTFERSTPIDLKSWEEGQKVGEYHKSENGDTFAYTEIIEGRGSERLPEAKTIAFTSRPREEVIADLGEPIKSDVNQGVIIPLPSQRELDPAA